MKRNLFPFLLLLLSSITLAQEKDSITEIKFDNKTFLKEISENACKCIDSISVYNKSKKEISSEIHACIDKQCGAYQLGIKLAEITTLKNTGKAENINIDINVNLNSKEYKKYYYEIETSLMENCTSIKEKVTSSDKLGAKSLSSDKEAMKYYNLGLDEGKKENWEKAIDNYKKAVIFDSEFAFAYDNMGICYRRLNKYDEAIESYEKSLKIDPNGEMPLQNIAVVYLYKKEYRKAVKSYERLAKIDSKNPEVYYGMGNIYAQYLFEYEKALDNLCQAYLIYNEIKSPYRSDAEKLIQVVYTEMKKQGKETKFNEILKKHHINPN